MILFRTMKLLNYEIYSETKLTFKDIRKTFKFILFETFFSSTKKNIKCDVCDCKNFRKVDYNYHRIIDKKIYIKNLKNILLSCSDCGTIFQSKKYSNFYNYYFLNKFYGITMPGINDFLLTNKAKRRTEVLNKILSELNRKNINIVLEISSHDGSTLCEMKKKFPTFDFYGLEPVENVAAGSQKRYDFLRGKIICSLAEKHDFSKVSKTYDLVLFSHALRMINDPNKFIEKLKKFLSKDGLILVDEGEFIDTGETDPIVYKRGLRTQKVNFFTFDSLSYFFEKHGFKEIYREQQNVSDRSKPLNQYNCMLVFKRDPDNPLKNKNKLNKSKEIVLRYLREFDKVKNDIKILFKI